MADTPNLENAAKVVEEKIDAARESVADRGARVRAKLDDVAGDVRQKARELRDKIAETSWDDVVDKTSGFVRDHPGKALGIALATGFVLGLLFRRRDD
ncbi:MAG: YqjD family protein [Thermoanaerobaculia bacterium]